MILCKLLLDHLHFKGMVDYLTVHQDGKVEFTFLDGSKIFIKKLLKQQVEDYNRPVFMFKALSFQDIMSIRR